MSENTASYLDYNLEDVPELSTVPEGEYRVICKRAEVRTSTNSGNQYVSLQLEVADEPASPDINHVVMLPGDGDDEKQKIRKLNRLRDICRAFNVSTSGQIDMTHFQGQEAWALITEEEDPTYGTQNRVKKIHIPA
jgi:hypothetical protein